MLWINLTSVLLYYRMCWTTLTNIQIYLLNYLRMLRTVSYARYFLPLNNIACLQGLLVFRLRLIHKLSIDV